MHTNWLNFQSLRDNQEILKAINTLSLHLKIGSRDGVVEKKGPNVERSIEALEMFFNRLSSAADTIDQTSKRGEAPAKFGVDPRLRQLVDRYLHARHQRQFHSRFFTASIQDAKMLLRTDVADARNALIECLHELRVMVEEHMQPDVLNVLDEI